MNFKNTFVYIETGLCYYGVRYLDPKYSMWLSCDPALSEYIPAVGKATTDEASKLPGMGGLFNHVNHNLYHYAGNNPVKYTDPDGRMQFQVQEKYKMQDGDWKNVELSGTAGGKANTLEYVGCAVTVAANLLSTAGLPDYDPAKVNDDFVSNGLVSWEDVGEKVRMEVEAVRNSEFTGSVFAKQYADKNTGYLTLVNVNYDAKGSDHWVGVIGMETIDGTDYLKVSPTSVNDSAVGKDSLRGKQGWRKNSEGDILVPTSETKGYVNFKAPIIYE